MSWGCAIAVNHCPDKTTPSFFQQHSAFQKFMYKSTCRKHFQHDLSLNSIIKVRILAILKGQVTYELGFTRSVQLLFVAISPRIWLFNVTSWTYLGCFNGDVQVTYEPIAGREELGCTQGVELPSVAVWPGSLFFQWRRDLFGALLNYILNVKLTDDYTD